LRGKGHPLSHSLNNWTMKISNIYGIHVGDEHEALV
jgi:hypothetical protein